MIMNPEIPSVDEQIETVAASLKKAILASQRERELSDANPVYQEQGRLAHNWINLCGLEMATRKTAPFCPKCGRPLTGFTCCGMSLSQMVELAGVKMKEHSELTGKALEGVRKQMKEEGWE